jgi:hypothetical protein
MTIGATDLVTGQSNEPEMSFDAQGNECSGVQEPKEIVVDIVKCASKFVNSV